MDKHLHIITHDIPWPADYGGVFDLFYKIKWLHKLGIRIHLHCFFKDRKPAEELNAYCEEVFYYPRRTGIKGFSFSMPYIVSSRRNKLLKNRILSNNYPVLMEGIHCTWLLHDGSLDNRKTLVRLHNVECNYYDRLAAHESNFFKKIYFKLESRLLKKYERCISKKTVFVAVSEEDKNWYQEHLGAKTVFLPVFLPWDEVKQSSERGCFCLYHGNLSVNENEKVADWLMNEVFNTLDIPLIIAGKKPSLPLQSLAHSRPHTCITCSPSENEMDDLIRKAHVHILPSFNQTGVKLKLLNALYNGRHCIVNQAGAKGSGTETLCHVAESANDFKAAVSALYKMPFSENDIEERKKILARYYNNQKNAQQLIAWLH